MGQPISSINGLSLMQRRQAGWNAHRAVFIGDSITAGSIDNTYPDQAIYAANFPSLACALSQGRALLVRNKGVGGQTSTQILARFQADVIDLAPGLCHILCGTNDVEGAVAWTTTLTNIETMLRRCRQNGITPILGTIPAKTSATVQGQINRHWVNQGIRNLADRYNCTLIDYFKVTLDPTTGGFLSTYSDDGVHPNRAGQKAMAQAFADTIQYLLPPASPLTRTTTSSDRISIFDAMNLINHGCFVTDSNADGVPEFWTGGADANHTLSLVTDANIAGKWAQCAKTNSSLKTWLQETLTTYSASDLVIDGTNAYKCTSASKPFSPNGANGMILVITGGTGFTQDRFLITDRTTAVCTVDAGARNLGTLGATGGQGRWGYAGGFEEGDAIGFGFLLQTESVESGSMTYTNRLNFTGSGGKFLSATSAWTYDTNITGGALVYVEGEVPAGTTSIVVENIVNAGTGTIRIAQQTLLNLTKLRLV